MSREFWTSWSEQPVVEVVLIWLSVILAFIIAIWQVGPALAGL